MPITGTVGTHMRPLAEYPSIDVDATLGDVFALIRQRHDAVVQFRSVLVFDQNQRLIGKISLHDLLEILLPDYLTHLPAHVEGADSNLASLALLWQDDSADHVREVACQRVGDHLQPAPAPLKPDDPLTLAHYRFAHSNLNTLPVAENGRIVGVLRVVDVLAAIAATIHPV
jgi:predicted transcriptional regulator